MDKEDIKTCKEEAENYIEFMETAGDNAGWTRGLMWYIQHLEQKESILDKVTEFVTKIATENAEKYNSENQKEVDFSEWNLALEILNIIGGGIKND